MRSCAAGGDTRRHAAAPAVRVGCHLVMDFLPGPTGPFNRAGAWHGAAPDHKLSRPRRRANRGQDRASVRHTTSSAARPATASIVDVLVPVALDQSYSYRVPAGLELAPGDLVSVPLGAR